MYFVLFSLMGFGSHVEMTGKDLDTQLSTEGGGCYSVTPHTIAHTLWAEQDGRQVGNFIHTTVLRKMSK